jgi:hypothetical protein
MNRSAATCSPRSRHASESFSRANIDAANRNAADVFERTFTGILPRRGRVEGARIRAGTATSNAVNAAKGLNTWQGNEAAAS